MLCLDVLQLAFLNDLLLLSISYKQKGTLESTIVDFKRTDIQNLEEIGILSWLRRKIREIHRPIRHPKTRPEVL
jgi:hypothetical protein